MSAGICGKRVGFEDNFGSPSSGSGSAKKPRCSPFGSPTLCLDLEFGFDDKVSILLRMFPSVDRKVVESALYSSDHKIDDAIKALHALGLGNECSTYEAVSINEAVVSNGNVLEGCMSTQVAEDNAKVQNGSSEEMRMLENQSSWVDLFVQQMMNASGWDDVRGCTTKFLEAFERDVRARSTNSEPDIASLKEQIQFLLKDNHILKRGFAFQHEHNREYEEKLKEVPHLKQIISQFEEQRRKLEMDNYALKIQLQRTQQSSPIPSHFHPDIF